MRMWITEKIIKGEGWKVQFINGKYSSLKTK